MLNNVILYGFRKNWRGFGFLARKLRNNRLFVENKFAVKMNLNPQEIIDSRIILDGYFDEPVLHAILNIIKDDDVVWDIGANIGLHALSINKLRPNTRCFCFEPFYENFQQLMFNASLNSDIKINAFNFGLSSSISLQRMYSTPRNHGRTGFHEMRGTSPSEIQVLAIDGDSLIAAGILMPNIIKIDVEGHELEVFKGMDKVLSSTTVRAIIFEALGEGTELMNLLEKYSFTISKIDEQSNFLALRTS